MGRRSPFLKLSGLGEESLLWKMILLSFLAHIILFNIGRFSLIHSAKPTMEIDLTNFGSIGPKGGGKTASPARPAPPKAAEKEWVKPKESAKTLPLTTPQKFSPVASAPSLSKPASTSNPSGGSGGNVAGSGAGLNQLSRFPQLINLNDLQIILQRLYPEEARLKHIEATVVLDIHLDTDGRVTSTEIIKSAGSAFDQAAQKAAKLLKFTPAYIGSQPVAVKIRQAIEFKLAKNE